MEDQVNINDQNNQQIDPNSTFHQVQTPKKQKVNYLLFIIILIIVLIGLLTMALKLFFLRKNTPSYVTIPTPTSAFKSQSLSENEFDIIFMFNQDKNIPWTEEDKVEVKSLLKSFYPTIRDIYGERFDTVQQIQLNKLDPLANETSYAAPPNSMFLIFPLSKSTLIHELTHLFHYPNARLNSTYEEGFARAVEIEGLKRIYGTAERDFNSGDAILYDLYQTQALSPGSGSIHSGTADIKIERYNLAAFAFSKAYYEDPSFFKKYNEEVYRRVKNNTFSLDDLDKIFEKVMPTMENILTDIWISQQGVIDYKHTKTGSHILISGLYGANSFQLIERLEGGYERDRGRDASDPLSTAPLDLQYLDYNGNPIDSQTISLSYGNSSSGDKKKESTSTPGYYEPKIPPNYFGYYSVKARIAKSGESYETNSFGLYPYIEDRKGITGIIPGIITGTVSIYDAEGINKIADVEIIGGRFYADVVSRGTYKIVVNKENRMRYITKDNNPIVILIQ